MQAGQNTGEQIEYQQEHKPHKTCNGAAGCIGCKGLFHTQTIVLFYLPECAVRRQRQEQTAQANSDGVNTPLTPMERTTGPMIEAVVTRAMAEEPRAAFSRQAMMNAITKMGMLSVSVREMII